MKIKDYRCKCGHNDFFFATKGNQTGIYCSNCGKWLKWADKDEQNLALKTESTEKAIPLETLEKIREEMVRYSNGYVMFGRRDLAYAVDNCIKMLDKALKE